MEQACDDIIEILKNPPDNLPHIEAGDTTKNALLEIATALKQTMEPPQPTETQVPQAPRPMPPPRVIQTPNKHIGTPRITRQSATSFKKLATNLLECIAFWNTPKIAPQIRHRQYLQHNFDPATGKRETIDSLRGKYPELWEPALSNEWGRLADGNDASLTGTQTIEFIMKSEVPEGRDITYASFVCDHRPLKPEPFWVRIVFGGDQLAYNNYAGSPARSLIETKLILNNTISDASRRSEIFFC